LNTYKKEWEEIDSTTERLKIPKGWIVKSYYNTVVHQVIVEDPDHEWELGG
jgi:hypothetical protein